MAGTLVEATATLVLTEEGVGLSGRIPELTDRAPQRTTASSSASTRIDCGRITELDGSTCLPCIRHHPETRPAGRR